MFGYTESDDEYFDVLQNWFSTRFNWIPEQKWLVKTPGIVFALAMAVRAFTKEGEGVLINQPVTTHLAWLLMTTSASYQCAAHQRRREIYYRL